MGLDTFANTGSAEAINGAGGTDTFVYSEARSAVTTTVNGDVISVAVGNTVPDTLTNFERLQFSDGTLAFDVGASELAGTAYRIYKAAFARTPDNDGLKFWMGQLDAGTPLINVATGFVASAEFQSVYGAAPTPTEIVARYYQNVLGREGEEGGVTFWVSEISSGNRTIQQVLADFSESPENIAGVAPIIADGIFVT